MSVQQILLVLGGEGEPEEESSITERQFSAPTETGATSPAFVTAGYSGDSVLTNDLSDGVLKQGTLVEVDDESIFNLSSVPNANTGANTNVGPLTRDATGAGTYALVNDAGAEADPRTGMTFSANTSLVATAPITVAHDLALGFNAILEHEIVSLASTTVLWTLGNIGVGHYHTSGGFYFATVTLPIAGAITLFTAYTSGAVGRRVVELRGTPNGANWDYQIFLDDVAASAVSTQSELPVIDVGHRIAINGYVGGAAGNTGAVVRYYDNFSFTTGAEVEVLEYVALGAGDHTLSLAELAEVYIDTTLVDETAGIGTLELRNGVLGEDITVYATEEFPLHSEVADTVTAGQAYGYVLENWAGDAYTSESAIIPLTTRVGLAFTPADAAFATAFGTYSKHVSTGLRPNLGTYFEFEGVRYVANTGGRTSIVIYIRHRKSYNSLYPLGAMGGGSAGGGKKTYPGPFKIKIVNSAGTQVGDKIEWPGGLPINADAISKQWSGPFDEANYAKRSGGYEWYPPIPINAALSWESAVPALLDVSIMNAVALDHTQPPAWALKGSYSVNPADLCLQGGVQYDGIRNAHAMPFDYSTYEAVTGSSSSDPYIGAATRRRSHLEAMRYWPGNQGQLDKLCGPGGVRSNRAYMSESAFHHLMYRRGTGPVNRADDGTPWETLAWHTVRNHYNAPYIHTNRSDFRPHVPSVSTGPLYFNLYYGLTAAGVGGADTNIDHGLNGSPSMAYTGGEWVPITSTMKNADNDLLFAGWGIDYHHNYQFGSFNSRTFRAPELFDLGEHELRASFMVEEAYSIFRGQPAPTFGSRIQAWRLIHVAQAYANALSAGSFSRNDLVAFVASDLAWYYDTWKTLYDSTPGNWPATANAMKAYLQTRVGPIGHDDTIGCGIGGWGVGYLAWSFALMKKGGLWDAIRADATYGTKVTWVTDMMLASMVTYAKGRWNDAPTIKVADGYTEAIAVIDVAEAAALSPANDPDAAGMSAYNSWAALAVTRGTNANGHCSNAGAENGRVGPSLLAEIMLPSLLRYEMDVNDAGLDTAITVVDALLADRAAADALLSDANKPFGFHLYTIGPFRPINAP